MAASLEQLDDMEARSAAQTVREYLDDVYDPKVLQHAKGGAATKARLLGEKGGTWKTLLGDPLAQLTRDAIEKALADRKEAGKSAGTLLRDWSAFRAMLADAVDRGHLAAVPMARRPEPIRKLRGNQRVRYLGQRDEANNVWQESLKTAPDNETLLKTIKRLRK